MKRILRVFSGLAVAALLFTSNMASMAAPEDQWKEIDPSPAYLDYLEHPDDYINPPPYYDSSAVDDQVQKPKVPQANNLPSRYFVAEDGVTPVIKDQKNDGTCTIFSVTGNYEILTAKNNDERHFSEYHAKHALASNYSDGINPYGFGRDPNGGLYLRNMAPYYMNGRGPVNENFTDHYITGNDLVASNYINSFKPDIQTQEIKILPPAGETPSGSELNDWINELKSLVYEYGSVAITLDCDGLEWCTYLYYDEIPEYHGHAVLCVGWDDNIPAEYFWNELDQKTPSRNGGFIYKNSWDDDWGDHGYGYLSYDTAGIAMQEFQAITDYRERAPQEEVNTYSELGANSVIGINTTKYQWYGNKFYLDKGEQVKLKEVSFYAPISDISYDIYVSPTGSVSRNKFTYITSITPDLPGYYSVPANIKLGGDDFSEYFVVVKANCGNAFYSVPIEGSGYSGGFYANEVTKYIYYIDGDKRVILQDTTENRTKVANLGFTPTQLKCGYVAVDDGAFSTYSTSNIVVNAITEPYVELVPSIEASASSCYINDDLTVSTSVGGNGSGSYSYYYKVYCNDVCVREENGGAEYTFPVSYVGSYRVEVKVTDTVNGVFETAQTDYIPVEQPDMTVDFSISRDGNTCYITGSAEYPIGDATYYVYVMKDGRIVYKTTSNYLYCSFNASESGVYSVKVYAQDSNKNRVVQTHPILV